MNNDRLTSIFETAADDLKALAAEGQREILADIAAAAEEAQAQEKESIKMTFGFQIVLDMGADKQSNTLSWSVKRKLTADHSIANPDQMELSINND